MSLTKFCFHSDFTVANLRVNGIHDTRGLLSSNPFSGRGLFNAEVRNFRFVGTFQLNTIAGNFLNVRSMQSTITMDAIFVHLDGFGAQTGTINAVLNANLLAHIRRPETQARLNDRMTTIILPLLNGAFNQLTMTDLVA
jgi:hypothetical protein